jgi:hypothetical protein
LVYLENVAMYRYKIQSFFHHICKHESLFIISTKPWSGKIKYLSIVNYQIIMIFIHDRKNKYSVICFNFAVVNSLFLLKDVNPLLIVYRTLNFTSFQISRLKKYYLKIIQDVIKWCFHLFNLFYWYEKIT